MTVQEWIDHPTIQAQLPYLVVQEGDGKNGARHRVEVERHIPTDIARLSHVCVVCEGTIRTIRTRNGWKSAYFSATCELRDSYACARSSVTRTALDLLRAKVKTVKSPRAFEPSFL